MNGSKVVTKHSEHRLQNRTLVANRSEWVVISFSLARVTQKASFDLIQILNEFILKY